MIELDDSTALLSDGPALAARLREDSYLYFPRLLPRSDVLEVRKQIVSTLVESGWLAEASEAGDAVAGPDARPEVDGDPAYFAWYRRVQQLQAFHELAHHPTLVSLVDKVLGDEVLVHPRKIARAALPSSPTAIPTPPHQDFPLIQGATDTLTAWVPFGDYTDELGGLRVLPGSADLGLQRIHLAPGVGGVAIDGDMESAGEWRTTTFKAGDVLLFHSFTVHAARGNHTDRLRLSADYRYQKLSDPVVSSSLEPHYPTYLPAYDVLTEGWSSTASVDTPTGVKLAAMGDVFDPALFHPESTLITPSG